MMIQAKGLLLLLLWLFSRQLAKSLSVWREDAIPPFECQSFCDYTAVPAMLNAGRGSLLGPVTGR